MHIFRPVRIQVRGRIRYMSRIFFHNAENAATRYRMHIFRTVRIQVRGRIRYMSRIFLHASKKGGHVLNLLIK